MSDNLAVLAIYLSRSLNVAKTSPSATNQAVSPRPVKLESHPKTWPPLRRVSKQSCERVAGEAATILRSGRQLHGTIRAAAPLRVVATRIVALAAWSMRPGLAERVSPLRGLGLPRRQSRSRDSHAGVAREPPRRGIQLHRLDVRRCRLDRGRQQPSAGSSTGPSPLPPGTRAYRAAGRWSTRSRSSHRPTGAWPTTSIDTHMTLSGSVWWEPLGAYGEPWIMAAS